MRNKFNAKPTVVDGVWFPSKKEANRWVELLLAQKADLIYGLHRQVKFPLLVNDITIGSYVADFVYTEEDHGEEYDKIFKMNKKGSSTILSVPDYLIIEDTKGQQTPLFKWKKKHFEAQYQNQTIILV